MGGGTGVPVEPQSQPYYNINGVRFSPGFLITNINTGENYFADKQTTLGSFYQFGRRYGAPSTTTDTTTGKLTIAQGNSLSYASRIIGNPYDNTPENYKNGYYGWCTEVQSSTYDTLWNTSKGQYDPCPSGWRVPTKSELEKLWSCYVGKETYYDKECYRFDYAGTTLFIPVGRCHTWGTNGLRTDLFRVMSCELYTNTSEDRYKVPYHLRLGYSPSYSSSNYGVTAEDFPSADGYIRAVMI